MDGRKAMVGRFHIAHGRGIERVNGKGPKLNGTFVTDKEDFAAASSRVAIKVRRGGVTLTCNDELILDWRGRGEQLSLPQDFVIPNKQSLGLAWQAEFTIHQMTLIPGGGDWTPLFDGRDKKDWNSTKPENWKMDSNVAVVVGYGIGKRAESWLLTDHEYGDFRLLWNFNWPGKATAVWECGSTRTAKLPNNCRSSSPTI